MNEGPLQALAALSLAEDADASAMHAFADARDALLAQCAAIDAGDALDDERATRLLRTAAQHGHDALGVAQSARDAVGRELARVSCVRSGEGACQPLRVSRRV